MAQYTITLWNRRWQDGVWMEVPTGYNLNCDTNHLWYTNGRVVYGSKVDFAPPEGGTGCWKKLQNPENGWLTSTPTVGNEEFDV